MQRGSLKHRDPDSISCPEIIKLRPQWDLIVHLIGPEARYCSDWATGRADSLQLLEVRLKVSQVEENTRLKMDTKVDTRGRQKKG